MIPASKIFETSTFFVEGLQLIQKYGSFEQFQTTEFLQALSNDSKVCLSRAYYNSVSTITLRKKFRPSAQSRSKFSKEAFDEDGFVWSRAGVKFQ